MKNTEIDVREIVMSYGKDILDSDNMKLEKVIPHHGVISCFDHSLFVTYLSVWIAKRFNMKVDMSSLVRGALLHDYYLYDWHIPDPSHRLHGFIHAKKALENARKEYSLTPIEEDIIYKHMFPMNLRLPLYKETLIVCIADKFCASCELCSLNAYVGRHIMA